MIEQLGSVAGNLMIKHAHREFPSDVFIALETVGAQITICEFLKMEYPLCFSLSCFKYILLLFLQ